MVQTKLNQTKWKTDYLFLNQTKGKTDYSLINQNEIHLVWVTKLNVSPVQIFCPYHNLESVYTQEQSLWPSLREIHSTLSVENLFLICYLEMRTEEWQGSCFQISCSTDFIRFSNIFSWCWPSDLSYLCLLRPNLSWQNVKQVLPFIVTPTSRPGTVAGAEAVTPARLQRLPPAW